MAAKARAIARAQPLNVQLELTYTCNWSCLFCYNPRHHQPKPMSRAEWLAVLDDLRELGTLTVCLTGGEPMTHPEFFEIAEAVRERAFALKIFTNGSLAGQAEASRIAEMNPVSVELSLHGATSATHDRTTSRPGSWEALMTGIVHLKGAGLRLLLKTPVTSLNEHEIEAIVDLARRLEIPHQLNVTMTPRDNGDLSPLAFSPSREGVRRVMDLLRAEGKLPSSDRVRGGTNCGLGTITMAIDPEGNVFPCIQWRTAALGNVHDRRLRDLWLDSPERFEAATSARQANDALVDAGGVVAQFPFCPALARQISGDATTLDGPFRMRAETAGRVRWNENEPSSAV